MSVRDSQSKRVSFDTPDNLEQKIDRLTVMMGKLVTEQMKGTQNHLSHTCISLIEVEIRLEVIIIVDLEIMLIGDTHHTIKTLEVETEITLAIEENMGTTCEVIRGIETITMIIGETIIEVKVMIEIGVGH